MEESGPEKKEFISKCCKYPFRVVIDDKGKWELHCDKCDRACAEQERYSINKNLPFS